MVARAKAHKITSAISLLAFFGFCYYAYGAFSSTPSQTRYVLARAERGTIVSSVTGTGQVLASQQIDLKPKAGGDVVYVSPARGQVVHAGQLIVALDSADAQKGVRDAEANLQSAQIALQKLTEPADTLSLTQAQNALSQAQSDYSQGLDNGFSSVSNAFLNLPSVMSGLYDALYGHNNVGGNTQDNASAFSDMVRLFDNNVTTYKDAAIAAYLGANDAYNKTFADYKATSRGADAGTLTGLIGESYDTSKKISDAIKSATDLYNFVKDRLTEHSLAIPSTLTVYLTNLGTYTGQVNGDVQSLLTNKTAIETATSTILEKQQSLQKLKAGADSLDIQSSQLTLLQRRNALLDAQQTLNNYAVYAPFAGTLAKVNVKKYDSVSAGSAVATLVTSDQLAEVTLNEVDVAKVRVGQKATLTFDAIDGLSITGEVASVDTVGTVSQGVVTYTVDIHLDTQDAHIKPGMSVSAAIISGSKTDALIVPSSAVKSQGGASYVEVFNPPVATSTDSAQGLTTSETPIRTPVTVGLTSDSAVEITSGLDEGEQIISRTISAATTVTQQAPSLIGSARGGGNVRIQTGGR